MSISLDECQTFSVFCQYFWFFLGFCFRTWSPTVYLSHLVVLFSRQMNSRIRTNDAKFDEAKLYVAKVKRRFADVDRQEVYRSFLGILHWYHGQQSEVALQQVHTRVSELFSGHLDLLEEFENFLPNGAESEVNTF